MAFGVDMDKTIVLKDMHAYYGYEAKTIKEVAGGTVGYTYSIDDQYFLKIYDTELVATQRCTENLLEKLTVLDLLHQSTSLGDKICYPIKTTDDQYFYAKDNRIGVLFNLIQGETIGYGNAYTPNQFSQLVKIVEELHRIESKQFEQLCPKEEFDLSFCDELIVLLENQIAALPEDFYHLVKLHKHTIGTGITEAKNLVEEIKQMHLPFVLCHTDIHGGNIMVNGEGKLLLLDWENVMLAPKEADLFMLCEEVYFSELTKDINEKALRYYIIRRDLEDVWEFLNGVLHDEYGQGEIEEVFGHLKRILAHLDMKNE